MKQKMTNLRSKAVALGRLLMTSDAEFKAFMNTYDPLFIASAPPENTKDDYDNGVPLQGYKQGSSSELEQYYKIIHLLCTLGSVEKMYMPPALDVEKSVLENQNLLERQLVKDIAVGDGDSVLDLGCGCGAIAEHVATLSGCTVYGINIEKSQIEKAWENANRSQLHFSVGDFNKPLDFGDNMFDAVYNVQALTYATDLEFTFKEVSRVLKPGGKFFSNDVAALDNYDRENDQHKLLIQHTRELTAFGGFWHYKYWEDAFKNAGFEVISSEGKSAVEMIRMENALYERFERTFSFLSTIHLVPRKIDTMLRRMHINCESYIKAEEEELITLNWKYVTQKPERSSS
jgi:sterol 24-C-methyltransferase